MAGPPRAATRGGSCAPGEPVRDRRPPRCSRQPPSTDTSASTLGRARRRRAWSRPSPPTRRGTGPRTCRRSRSSGRLDDEVDELQPLDRLQQRARRVLDAQLAQRMAGVVVGDASLPARTPAAAARPPAPTTRRPGPPRRARAPRRGRRGRARASACFIIAPHEPDGTTTGPVVAASARTRRARDAARLGVEAGVEARLAAARGAASRPPTSQPAAPRAPASRRPPSAATSGRPGRSGKG